MKIPEEFIVIDDDESNNMLCRMIIQHALGKDIDIKTFTMADDGINHIKAEGKNLAEKLQKVLFLDINMPMTNGWEALDMLNELDENSKNALTIYMVSSSIDPKEKIRALGHPLVHSFIEKPLTIKKIEEMFSTK